MVNLPDGEHKTDKFKDETRGAQNIPVFISKDIYLTDSIEIVYHLIQTYDKDGKFGGPKLKEWGQYVSKNVDDVVLQVYLHTLVLPEASRSPNVVKENTQIFDTKIVPHITQGLGGQTYFGGDKISAVDCVFATILAIAESIGLLQKHVPLKQYMERICQREHFIKSHVPHT